MSTATAARQQSKPAKETPERIQLPTEIQQASAALDVLAEQYALTMSDGAMGRLQRALITAKGVELLRDAINDDVMKMVMSLMDNPLGFRCDKAYPKEKVKEVLVAALLSGVYPLGNEFNIIAGNLYITQNGYRRKVRELPGLTDLVVSPGVPTVHNGQTCVRFGATWKLDGKPQMLRDAEGKPGRVFAIITHGQGSPDQAVGKAIRKGLKAVYDQVTGSEQSGEVDDADVSELLPAAGEKANGESSSRAEQLANRLKGQAEPKAAPEQSPAAPVAVEDNPLTEAEIVYNELLQDINAAETTQDLDQCQERLRKVAGVVGSMRHEALVSAYTAKGRALRKR